MEGNENLPNVLDYLKSDEYFLQFLTTEEGKDNMNLAISCSLTVAEQLSKLTKGINLLEKEIYNIVINNHEDFLSQRLWLDKFESRISVLKRKLEDVLTSADNIRKKIDQHYDKIETECKMVNRLYQTCVILRCVVVMQQLIRHLPEEDLIKASALVREVDEVSQDIDLTGLDILEHDQRLINAERLKLQENAEQLLSKGLQQSDENQAIIAIRILANLRTLEQVINEFLRNAVSHVEQNVKSALDVQSFDKTDMEKSTKTKTIGPGKITGGTFPGGNVTNFRSKFWNSWSNLLETAVFSKCTQVYMLETLLHKRDSQDENDYKFEIENKKIALLFWKQISEVLSKHLIKAAQGSSFIKQALEGEYPKLLRLHADLNKNLQKFCKPNEEHSYPFIYNNHFSEQFETAYLSRSLSRLINNVESIFSGDELPAKDQIDTFIHIINSELSVSTINEALCNTVIRNIDKAIRLFHIKCEQMLVLEGNFTQVIDPPNENQKLNTNVSNIAYYLKQHVNVTIRGTKLDLSPSILLEVNKTLNNLDSITNSVLIPICTSICEAIESIILTMHDENFETDDNSCSLYIKELKTFISRAVINYLKPFSCQELLYKGYKAIAIRCIDLFLRHACLKRPLQSTGRQKLAADFTQIESVISPLWDRPNELGKKYKLLKTFGTLICLSAEKIEESELLGDIVPYSLALMYLFSYAPSDMLSPHKSCDWSIARLSQWLDNHTSERERLELIRSTIQRYQQDMRQQNKSLQHQIYPIMIKLLETAFSLL